MAEIDKNKIVVFTGAGVSAESGIKTFRDSSDGLWENHSIDQIATFEGFERNPRLVLDFYNQRLKEVLAAKPNAAHLAIAKLQENYDVIVITQNVDNLHERAGSKNVIHLHGQLGFAQSSIDDTLVYDWKQKPIHIGQHCELNSQLRPNVVWFGEQIRNYDLARSHIKTASKVLVVGTSLEVMPAAGLLKHSRGRAEKVIVSLEVSKRPYGFKFIRGKASVNVPLIINNWLLGKPNQ